MAAIAYLDHLMSNMLSDTTTQWVTLNSYWR